MIAIFVASTAGCQRTLSPLTIHAPAGLADKPKPPPPLPSVSPPPPPPPETLAAGITVTPLFSYGSP